jgi:glycosyltransferase involved in cell wall biosynthesis
MAPKVSIILSLYNSANSVSKTVESILNQSYKNYELIIINDGSTDNTKKILNKYKKQKKIKIFNFNSNLGLAKRLNFGISKSISNYVLRIDDNDQVTNDRIKFQLDEFKKNSNLDIFGGSAIYINGKKKKKIKVLSSNHQIKKKLKFFNPIIHSSIMFKKKSILKIGGYNELFKRCQDYELWLRGRSKLNFKNSKKVFVIRDVSTFKYKFSNLIFLFKARILNFEKKLIILCIILLIKDLIIYILLKTHIKKII